MEAKKKNVEAKLKSEWVDKKDKNQKIPKSVKAEIRWYLWQVLTTYDSEEDVEPGVLGRGKKAQSCRRRPEFPRDSPGISPSSSSKSVNGPKWTKNNNFRA